MIRISSAFCFCLLSVLLVVVTGRDGVAAVFVYEPFGGAADTTQLDTSSATGTGFGANTWQDVGTNTQHINRNAWSTQFPLNSVFTSPNNLMAEMASSASFVQWQSSRNLVGVNIDLGQDQITYLSFSSRVLGNDTYATVSLHDSATGNVGVAVGHHWGGNNAAGNPFLIAGPLGGGALFSGGTFTAGVADLAHASGENLFYVAKIVSTSSGTDQVFLKVYENGVDAMHASSNQLTGQGAAELNWTVVSAGGSSSLILDQLRIAHSGTGFPQVDEIRIGSTWQDVTGVLPQALQATNGDFEASGQVATGNGTQNIVGWFDSTPNFSSWEFGRPGSGGNPVEVAGTMSSAGWIYQSLGTYYAEFGNRLEWSLDVVNSNINNGAGEPFELEFLAGDFLGAEGVDIASGGLLSLGTATLSASGTGVVDLTHYTGSVSLDALADGTEVWVRIQGGDFDGVDNFFVQQVPEPMTLSLVSAALVGVFALRFRRRR